jgi:hypothetical protein
MAELPSDPTLTAIIMVGIATLAVFTTVIMLLIRYLQRRKMPALTLVITFLFWGLGGLSVFVMFILHYLNGPGIPAGDVQFARYGINLGYLFSAISNIFMVLFVSQIFSQSPLFRRTKSAIPIINAILNGITIGLIINAISLSLDTTNSEITEIYNPTYPIAQTVFHLVMTLFAFILLQGFSIKYRRQASTRWERVGFNFINYYAMSGMMIYILFAVDLIVAELFVYFENGYTIFNYLGWACAVLMAIFGYLGYAMPSRIRNMLKEKEEK